MDTAKEDLRADRRIANDLRHAWPAFFERFGRLTSVQRAAIPPILDRRDVLVCAATATGKTEAACAPLIERFMARRVPWTILYISPTRALVNDLYMRLFGPIDQLQLTVDRRTGDYPRALNALPNVLLTTPESFDSMLCRGRRPEDGHVLERVVAVVLDEVHLLHGTPRGEQTIWLLERLRRTRVEAGLVQHLQTVALSATISDPEAVQTAFLPGGEAIVIPGGRTIETVVPASASARVEEALVAHLQSRRGGEKILVFCNERRRVDELTAWLRAPLGALGYVVHAHHGSLDRRERERAEEDAKLRTAIVIVATSTLEIGIDIGDIDLVVLDGPPPDIPALLQRIGRGNRRTDVTRVLACSRTPAEAVVQSAMIEAARDGWLGPKEKGPHHAVARQQIASAIYQGRRVTTPRRDLEDLLATCAAPIVTQGLLPAMITAGELTENMTGIGLGADWRDRASSGAIHSNIESTPGKAVVDEDTGDVIARGITSHGGSGMLAGGHFLQIQQWDAFRIGVRKTGDPNLTDGEWRYAIGTFLRGAGQPQAVRRYLDIADNVWPVVHLDESSYIFHFGGGRRQAMIELAVPSGLRRSDVTVTPWYIRLTQAYEKPVWLTTLANHQIVWRVHERLAPLERILGRPRANGTLPDEIRTDEIIEWLNVEKEVAAIHDAVWQSITDADVNAILCDLVDMSAAAS